MTEMIPRAEADALVAAAYEAAAKAAKKDAESGDISDGAAQWVIDTIRALISDDARAALEAMLAEAEKRGEKRGMLRAAEIADGAADDDQKEGLVQMAARARYVAIAVRAEAAAIRAEAEE